MEKNLNRFDTTYAQYIRNVLNEGTQVEDRTRIGTLEVFGMMVNYDNVSVNNFPLLTVKQTPFKSVLGELLWFLEGSTDERRLAEITFGKSRDELEGKKTIWTDNQKADYWKGAKFEGDLGNVYGKMWRSWPVYDVTEHRSPLNGATLLKTVQTSMINQIDRVIEDIKTNPTSRRHIVLAWNPAEQTPDKVALPPCHYAFQFNVTGDKLNLLVHMRSNDIMLGAPFNIASYALLLNMIAQVTQYKVGSLKFSIGSAHIYLNHIDGAFETLRRVADQENFAPPQLIMDDSIKHIDDFKMESFGIANYTACPKISLPMAT